VRTRRADSSGAKGTGLLLALALLSNACVSLTPRPGPGRSLRYTPHDVTGPALAGGAGEESPLVLASQPPFSPGPEAPERLHRRRGSREAVTEAGPGGVDATVWQSALAAHLAFRKGVGEVSGTTRRISGELSRLKHSNEVRLVERTMSDGRAWEGNIKARLYERVRERGFDSLTAFAEARPAVPLHLLAEELGKDDVAGVQVLSGLLAEAERRKQVTRFVRDVFARLWSESVPDGWPTVMDDDARFAVAEALGCWTAYTPETHKDRVKQARAALRVSSPPPGWRPLGADDELLLTLLPDEAA
jgi:hypothetical protein